jgi:hypothetical protein
MTVSRSATTPDATTPAGDSTLPTEDAIESRANLLPEEEAAGSDDPRRQAEVILEESSERVLGTGEQAIAREHRTSEDTVEPLDNE